MFLCYILTYTSLLKLFSLRASQSSMLSFMTFRVYDACTVPTLLYGSEGWILTKEETEKIEAINNNILKRFLKTPKNHVKRTHLYGTGSTPISSMIDSRQVLYYKKKT